MITKRPAWARGTKAFEGKRYGISCGWHGDGEVFSFDENRVVLKFCNEPTPRRMMYGLMCLPEFVVFNQDNLEQLRIRRTRRFFRQVFEIRDSANIVGEVIRRNPVCRSYELNLANGTKWNFSLPLFTTGFFGDSSSGGRLLFWVKSHKDWQIVVDTEHDSTLLIAAIAFIHREYLRHQ